MDHNDDVRSSFQGESITRLLIASVTLVHVVDMDLDAIKLASNGNRIIPALIVHQDDRVDELLVSHLGMSGRWLFWPKGRPPDPLLEHVHLKLSFEDGATLWYQDIRRFGMLRVVPTARLAKDASLKLLGPDPLAVPRDGQALGEAARGSRVAIKVWLLDQRRIAGLGNIYASEVLFRAKVSPRRRAGALRADEWTRIAREIPAVLEESIARMGTTFSTYRTLWNEPGQYGERLLVYDRAGEPCRNCGTAIRRMVQGGRATYFCPECQRR